MDIKEAFSVIDKYGLSSRENKVLSSTVLNEPPHNATKRYEIKTKIIGEKIVELKRQLDVALNKHGITIFSDYKNEEIVALRKAIDELTLARRVIEHEMRNDFWCQ